MGEATNGKCVAIGDNGTAAHGETILKRRMGMRHGRANSKYMDFQYRSDGLADIKKEG